MFGKKKKQTNNQNLNSINKKFVIPQITESLDGLKTRKGYFQKSDFASSLFGSGIKDVSTYHDNASEGMDVRRTYDNFRSKEDKKISEQELLEQYGTKYPEFQQMNINTAQEVYGEKITVNKKTTPILKEVPKQFSFIMDKNEVDASDMKDNNVQIDSPEEEINEPNLEPISSGFDFSIEESDSIEDESFNEQKIESFKPTIQISSDDEDEDDFFNVPKEVNYTNIVRRTKEEMEEIRKTGTPYNPQFVANDEPKPTEEKIENKQESVILEPQVEIPASKPNVDNTARVNIPTSVNPYKNYIFPPIDRFKRTTQADLEIPQWVIDKKEIINETLTSFDISGEVTNFTKGPTFTRYEVLLQNGVNVRKIANLTDTFQANLGVTSIRIQAPIPGKRTVGIEVPNDHSLTVWFGDIITDEFVRDGKPLNVALGKDIDGNVITSDISKWPHGLVAGSTGSGKSVCINTLLVSLLLKNKPDDLKLILVDPKQVELITYNDLPHLITPVISDPKMASQALKWSVDEMERRYSAFAHNRAKNIKDYNEKALNDPTLQKLAYIVIIIDELADLMQVCSSDVEESIQRLTQKARAAGIHLICATQRPTTDVVKGTIKNNIPTRVAFKVTSQVDSFTIIDEGGAESLLGKGDMLLKEIERPRRLQGAFITDDEIDYVTDYIRAESTPEYVFTHEDLKAKFEKDQLGSAQNNGESEEMLYQASRFFIESETCSVNLLQQQFNVGFNRASRIVGALEEMGIVSGKQGTKGREILVTLEQLNEMFERTE